MYCILSALENRRNLMQDELVGERIVLAATRSRG
jgi:hypothetical protein